MHAGAVKKYTCTLEKFGAGIRKLQLNQAIAHGICEYPEARVVSARDLLNHPGTVARSKDFFQYPDGPGLGMFDHDPKPGRTPLSPEEFCEIVEQIYPAFKGVATLYTPSTSSCIFDASGKELAGISSGFHLYFVMVDAQQLQIFAETLFKRLVLAGHGYPFVTRSGSVLVRTIFDLTVFSPERLDFVAGAVCEGGCSQSLPDPIYTKGGMLEWDKQLLTPLEESQFKVTKEALIKSAEPESEQVRAQYVNSEVTKLVQSGFDPGQAERIITGRCDQNLSPDDVLQFDDGSRVTVKEALASPASYNRMAMRDPLEPEAGQCKAKFYANEGTGTPVIHSQLHGGLDYVLNRPVTRVEKNWFEEAVANGGVGRFIDNQPPELDWVFEGSLLSRTTGMLVGPGAVGKSTLMLLMLMAVATGRDILPGIFTPTRAGKVLGVFCEDDEIVLHHRMYSMGFQVFRDDQEALDLLRQNMTLVTTVGHDVRFLDASTKNLEESKFFGEVFKVIQNVENLRLIMLDPVSRFHGAEENDNGAGTFLVNLLERIAERTGAAVIIIHHVSKRAGQRPDGSFDLNAAMHQDVSRGASGLTNGVRWQCNLSALPEKNAIKELGVKHPRPGQYLALNVPKKNFGPPEPIHFLERRQNGLLLPCAPTVSEKAPELNEFIKGLLMNALVEADGRNLTSRALVDANCQAWKKDNPKITRQAIQQTILACVSRGELFELQGKNASGKSITYLSIHPKLPVNLEPEIKPGANVRTGGEPEAFKPEEPEGTGEIESTVHNSLNLNDMVKPEEMTCRKKVLRFVSPQYCETVEQEISTPYGGDISPSGSHRVDIPQLPMVSANA